MENSNLLPPQSHKQIIGNFLQLSTSSSFTSLHVTAVDSHATLFISGEFLIFLLNEKQIIFLLKVTIYHWKITLFKNGKESFRLQIQERRFRQIKLNVSYS